MPLLQSPDFGREVSTLATACPGCGRPVSTSSFGERHHQVHGIYKFKKFAGIHLHSAEPVVTFTC